MAISDADKYLLNNLMGSVAGKVQLGTLIENAEEGGLAALAVDTAELAADAVTGDKIEDAAVSIEHLDSGITPSHVVKYAGTFTTAGGDAAETITVAGVVATDVVMVMIKTEGASAVTCDAAAAGTGSIAVTMSADPSTDHVLQYVVYRAVA